MSSILAWLVGHEAVLAGLVVGVIDFVFSVNPAAQSNSFLGWLLAQANAIIGSGHSLAKLKEPKQ